MKNIFIFGIGFLAQILFLGRTIVQWFKSEQEGKVTSPTLFWHMSLFAAIMMFIYGILRRDAAILIGQFFTYFIYIRNLQLKDAWRIFPLWLRIFFFILPLAFPAWLIWDESASLSEIIHNDDISTVLMTWGICGQLLFLSRFFYQWIYSESQKESVLPMGFWIISLVGSAMIFSYAIFRLDPVLMMAHSIGLFLYFRNLMLSMNRGSLFDKVDIPVVNKVIKTISGKIK